MARSLALMAWSCGVALLGAILLAFKSLHFFWVHHSLFWTVEAAKIALLLFGAIVLYRRFPEAEPTVQTRFVFAAVAVAAAMSIVGDAGINSVVLLGRL